jgi:hypothetical protein
MSAPLLFQNNQRFYSSVLNQNTRHLLTSADRTEARVDAKVARPNPLGRVRWREIVLPAKDGEWDQIEVASGSELICQLEAKEVWR